MFSKIRKFSTNIKTQKLNKFSSVLTQDVSKGAAQAMLYAVGLNKNDMSKPQIGISSMWFEGNPCNIHLDNLSHLVKNSIQKNQMIGMRFNTIGVSDGMSMGTSGMRYSLPSREIIADSIETVMNAQHYDANISIPGCDKNIPACLMAMARVNRPSIMIYGGSIQPGCHKNKNIDIVDAFQSYGQYISGKINLEEREEIINKACNGSGACGGMYTANTMGVCSEVMGMTLPNSSTNPANNKISECELSGHYIKNLLENDIKPLDIMTKPAFENAIAMVMALGGSTNAVIHLLAIAHTVGIDLKLDDFQRISDKIPYIGNLKPSGEHHMVDLHKIGGLSVVIKYLISNGLLNGNILTVTGKTLWENVKDSKELNFKSGVIKPIHEPIKSTGHIQILYGNISPKGSVAKITGKEGTYFKGIAKVYESEQNMLHGLKYGDIQKGVKTVIVIRNEGPKSNGFPEMLEPTSVLVGMGLEKDCALITDGRFSGGSHGFIVGHITPEAYQNPTSGIALIRDGDEIEIDIKQREINNLTGISLTPFNHGNNIFKKPLTGYLRKYQKLVKSASEGCTTD